MSEWIFDAVENRVRSGESSVRLTPRSAAVLECLLRRKGEIVTREEILADVWPGLTVTKDLVREYVFDLRSALGDDAKNPTFIETVRGRGFRLIGPIKFAREETGGSRPLRIREVRPTIAVLRPEVYATGADWAYFAFDLADSIIARLANFHDIGVVSRNSSFAVDTSDDLSAAARRVGANYLLESSVVVLEDTVRIRFQLVDGASGRNLWAESYNSPIGNLSLLSEKISVAVVNALTGWHGELHRAEYKTIVRKDPEEMNAFEHFIAGAALDVRFDEESLRRNIKHLERSLALDPNFARCWVVRSVMLQWAFDTSETRDVTLLRESAASLEEAYLLDPGDPTTAALTSLKRCREGDLHGALQLVDRADASCETDADACVCVALARSVLSGDNQRARDLFDIAHSLNPTPPSFYPLLESWIAFFAGDYELCIQRTHSVPRQVSTLLFRALSHSMLDRSAAARQAHKDLHEVYPGFDFDRFAAHFPIVHPDARQHYGTAVARLRAVAEG